MTDLALNERAWATADRMAASADELRIAVHTLPNGARVIDAGLGVTGGVAAGLGLAEVCMGGLGHISIIPILIDGRSYEGVHVRTDHPAVSGLASQYAGWAVSIGEWFAMGSGPLRARARVERELFERLRYREEATRGVLVLEGRALPTADVAAWLAEKSRLEPSRLTLAIAPSASVAANVQIVARIVETGLHKMDVLGFDTRRVIGASGVAPLPPLANKDLAAIGRTNDAILYGGTVHMLVDADDVELEGLATRMPASASADHGTPFREIFERYDRDFYRIDPLLFSPAMVVLTSARTGRTVRGGRLEAGVLERSFFGA